MRFWLPIAGVSTVLAACAPSSFVGRPDLQVVTNAELPSPTRQDLTAVTRPHLIGPFDRISVEVFGIDELTRTVQVDANGEIEYPLLGVLTASGRTPPELASFIEEGLRGQYVRNPSVTVNVVETQSLKLTVDGEVDQPGLYPVVGQMTLMNAIARAGGATEFARQNHVVVFRRVNGQDMAALYDLRAIRRGIYADPEVYPNDVVVVGENQARRIFQDVLRSATILTAPVVAAIRR